MKTQNTPTAIPVETVTAARKIAARLAKSNEAPWWYREVPSNGIPIRFNGGGTVKAGIGGWIIDGHARTVYLGEAAHKTEIGEFVILVDGGSQVLAQVGRDFDFVNGA